LRPSQLEAAWRASLGLETHVVEAVDFVTGGAADFARACSPKGDVIEIARRSEGEPYAAFVERASGLTVGLGAPRLVIGGLCSCFRS